MRQTDSFPVRALTARSVTALLALSLTLLPWAGARADEGGVPFWLSGAYSSFAAVPQAPGFYMPTQLFYYNASADKTKTFQRGESVSGGLKTKATLIFFTPTWVPEGEKWFGGQPSFSLTFGGGSNTTSAEASVSFPNFGSQTLLNRSDSVTGFADLYPQAQIAWTSGYHNWMTYVMGDIPVGSYDSTRLSNIGLGHTAIDAGGAYTYFNTKGGFEASAIVGFTYNGENTHTNYQSGADSHLDWDVSQFLSDHWQVGIVGYAYYQLTSDAGGGKFVGSFKSQIAAVGPEVGYAFTAFGQQWYANIRAYREFGAKNRLEGDAAYATLSIPLGGGKKK